ncbi:MAG TPA: HEAT repeat domain-containing protein [Spirillospora sp.]
MSLMLKASTAELVSWLSHEEPRARELAAAYLGDRLDHACTTGAETDAVVQPLVEALERETDPVVQEEIARSLGFLVEHGTVPRAIVPALKECLPRLHAEAAEYINDIVEDADRAPGRA